MPKTMYDVTLRCEDMMAVSVLLGAVAGTAELVGIKQVLDQAMELDRPHDRTPLRAAPRMAMGEAAPLPWKTNDGGNAPSGRGRYKRKDLGISGKDLLMQILSESVRTYSYNEIRKRFEGKGFSPSSTGAMIYRAIKEHRVRNVGGSMYELVRDGANRAAP
jgi:hypothetical protein